MIAERPLKMRVALTRVPDTLPREHRSVEFTGEPGLYNPGVGGCRLEDLVLVTESGCENLTRDGFAQVVAG